MSHEVLLAVMVTLIVTEATDVSPWIAIRVARWAAKHIYVGNTDRAARREEEWEALIERAVPTKISKLFFGLGFGCAGLYCIAIRALLKALPALWRRIRPRRPSEETVEQWIAMAGLMVMFSLPDLVQAILFCALIGLWICIAGVALIVEYVRHIREHRILRRVTR